MTLGGISGNSDYSSKVSQAEETKKSEAASASGQGAEQTGTNTTSALFNKVDDDSIGDSVSFSNAVPTQISEVVDKAPTELSETVADAKEVAETGGVVAKAEEKIEVGGVIANAEEKIETGGTLANNNTETSGTVA